MHQYTAEQESRTHKLLGLELIRFLCTLSVLLWHYQHFSFIGDKPTNFIPAQLPFYSLLHIFYDYGHYAVHVFWCISGFIFFFNYRTSISAGSMRPKTFFVLRWSRLYPLHFVTLLLVLILQTFYFSTHGYYFVYQHNGWVYFAFQLFMAGSWGFLDGMSFNGPIWSVSLEILIYAFFYLALRSFGKSVWVNVIILSLCAWGEFHNPSPLFECVAFFYVGGLSAIAFQAVYFGKARLALLSKIISLVAALATPVVVYAAALYQYRAFPIPFLFAYLPVLLFSIAPYTTPSKVLTNILESAGNMTYASYLIHFPLQLTIALICTALQQEIPYYSPTFFAGFIIATLILSYFIFRFFELPARVYIRNRLLR